MDQPPALNQWKEVTEIVKNIAQVVLLSGGLFAFVKWVYERRDRATEVLLQLDEKFNSDTIRKAREYIDDDLEYRTIRAELFREVVRRRIPDELAVAPTTVVVRSDRIRAIDDLLHFYVLLCGVREANQVPDTALAKCFRYWLAHYYSPARRELRLYISSYYPTLMQWLIDDQRWSNRKQRKFF